IIDPFISSTFDRHGNRTDKGTEGIKRPDIQMVACHGPLHSLINTPHLRSGTLPKAHSGDDLAVPPGHAITHRSCRPGSATMATAHPAAADVPPRIHRRPRGGRAPPAPR